MDRNSLVGSRIIEARNLRGLKAKDLAHAIDVTTSRLSNWENGTSGVSADYIFKISEVLEVTSDFLIGLSDKPTDITNQKNTKEIIRTVLTMSKLNHEGQSKVCGYAKDIKLSGNYDIDEPTTPLTLSEDYTELYTDAGAAAGAGAYNYGHDDGRYVCTKITDIPDYDAIVDVRGESMEPTIKDGDVVFVDFNFDKKDGEIYIIQHEDDTYIKRCFFESDKLILRSDNPAYKDIVFKGQDEVRVIGIVTDWATPER